VGLGVWLRVPTAWLLGLVYPMDLVQIPLFFWLYEHGSRFIDKLPFRMPEWLKRRADRPSGWLASLGGFGIMCLAALPTFGGGMWSAIYLAHRLRLSKGQSTFWLAAGSFLSFAGLYWIISALASAIRYFSAVTS